MFRMRRLSAGVVGTLLRVMTLDKNKITYFEGFDPRKKSFFFVVLGLVARNQTSFHQFTSS